MAERVAKSLSPIDEATQSVDSLLNQITSACREQDEGLKFITTSMEQVDQATQANAASAEELAATTTETAGHVQVLNQLTGRFTLPQGDVNRKSSGSQELIQAPALRPAPTQTDQDSSPDDEVIYFDDNPTDLASF